MSTKTGDGDEEIEDDETDTWLDIVQDSTNAPEDDFDVESEIDWSAEWLSTVLAEAGQVVVLR
jgi:DNA-directed RNA polymerase sigma subunit (sigma70/sigma32)